VQQRGGQGDLLAHAVAVVDNEFVGRGLEVEDGEQLVGPLGGRLVVHPAEQRRVGQQLTPSEAVEQAEVLREHPDPSLHLTRLGPDVPAVDQDPAGIGTEQPGDHPEGGGLPGTVGAEQAEERAAGDVEVERVDGVGGTEPLVEAADRDGRGRREWRARRRRRGVAAVLGRRRGVAAALGRRWDRCHLAAGSRWRRRYLGVVVWIRHRSPGRWDGGA
jgi:hypothetical protein